jgi:hypothetical protein
MKRGVPTLSKQGSNHDREKQDQGEQYSPEQDPGSF